jgi:hypothetical protein
VIPCCMNSTISALSLPQKTVSISFLADKVYLNFFILFGEWMGHNYFDGPWFQHSQMKPRSHHLIWSDWEINPHLCGTALKNNQSWRKLFSALHMHLWVFLESIVLEVFWKFTQTFWIFLIFNRCILSTLWTKSSLTTNSQPLHSSSWTFVHLSLKHSLSSSYSSRTHYILTVNHTRIISMSFVFLAWRNWIAWIS